MVEPKEGLMICKDGKRCEDNGNHCYRSKPYDPKIYRKVRAPECEKRIPYHPSPKATCEFDKHGACHALACYSDIKCNAKDENGGICMVEDVNNCRICTSQPEPSKCKECGGIGTKEIIDIDDRSIAEIPCPSCTPQPEPTEKVENECKYYANDMCNIIPGCACPHYSTCSLITNAKPKDHIEVDTGKELEREIGEILERYSQEIKYKNYEYYIKQAVSEIVQLFRKGVGK